MIKPKEKPCKGMGIAHGFGCGKLTMHRINGLGKMCGCYSSWLLTSENGKIKLAKSIIHAKKETKKTENAFKSDLRQKLKTLSDYHKELQKEINTLVRTIDKGGLCISSQKPLNDKFDAGHFYSVGSNPSLRYHLDNIHAQSVYSNQHLSGDQINFLFGLELTYGPEYKDFVLELKRKYQVLKLTSDQLSEKTKLVKEIIKELRTNDKVYSGPDRLLLRKEFNERIGIYG
jgi:hypothetical protein